MTEGLIAWRRAWWEYLAEFQPIEINRKTKHGSTDTDDTGETTGP